MAAGTDVAGRITAEASRATGLAVGTPVVVGAHDVHAAAIGLGAGLPGSRSAILGTYNINQVMTGTARTDPRWQARCSVVPGRYLLMSTSPTGAVALDWTRRVLGGDVPVGEAVDRALARRASGTDPLFLPFLHGSAQHPAVDGAFTGLTATHGRDDLTRAVLEGIVLSHRWHLAALAEAVPGGAVSGGAPPGGALPGGALPAGPALRVGGGGSRSVVWTQLLADAVGETVEVTDCQEVGALGAAMLAGVGVGVHRDVDAAMAASVRVVRRQRPDPEAGALLDRRYRRWLDTIAALRTVG